MYRVVLSVFIAVIALFVTTGCNRTIAPPPPLPAEQIPAEFQKAFAKGPSPAKDLSAEVITALQTKNYPAAYEAVQVLCALPELSKDQQMLSSRALLTVTALLETAKAQGDQKAAASLNQYRSSR